ncbi:MAG: hypothetical protein CMN34_04285 [Saprospirales bacterium]|nr:hypothetical protein [Saprospirales bacterium]
MSSLLFFSITFLLLCFIVDMNLKEFFSLKGHQDESSRYIAFFVRILVIYLVWFLFREFMEKSALFRPHWDEFHILFSRFYIGLAQPVLEFFIQAPVLVNSQNIFLPASPPMFVAFHCVGVAPMAIMTMVFLWNPLAPLRRLKYWMIAMVTIAFLNWFRITTLGFMLYAQWDQFFYFSHSYTYILMIYGVLFLVVVSFFRPYFASKSI